VVNFGTPTRKGRRISIGGSFFTLATDEEGEPLSIQVYTPEVESQPFRTIGTQQRQDNRKVNKNVFGWSKGIGWHRQRRDTGVGVNGLRDADCDTSSDVAITLSHLRQSVANPDAQNTHSSSASDTVLQCSWESFAGEIVGIFQDLGAGVRDIRSRFFQATSDTWTLGVDVVTAGANTDQQAALDLVVHKGALYLLFGAEDNSVGSQDNEYVVTSQASPTGAWSGLSNAPGAGADFLDRAGEELLDDPPNNGYPLALLLDAPTSTRHDLLAALTEQASANGGSTDQTRIYHTADKGASSWTNTANVPGKPRGKAVWRDPFTVGFPLVPVFSTTENVFIIDAANTNAKPLLPESVLTGDDNDGFMAVGMDGALYVATAVGDIQRISVTSGGAMTIENIGPATQVVDPHTGTKGDGLVSSRRGPVTWMLSSTKFLYVAFQGSTLAHICKYSYLNGSWHSVYLHSDSDKIYRMALSTRDDGKLRLHIAIDDGADIDLFQFESPDDSLAVVSGSFETSGFVEFAEDDMSDPHANSIVLTGRVDADDLDSVSTIEAGGGNTTDIEHEYGLNGAAWTNVSNLGFYASDDKVLLFGKTDQNTPSAAEAGTPIGISAKTARHRLVFERDGTATNSPKLKEFQVETHNLTQDLKGFVIPVDIYATALEQQVDPEVIDDRIDTIIEATTLIALLFGEETDGSDTTYYVKAEPTSPREMMGVLPNAPGIGTTTERTKNMGIVRLRLEEMQGDT
jgi:hypothetical protein